LLQRPITVLSMGEAAVVGQQRRPPVASRCGRIGRGSRAADDAEAPGSDCSECSGVAASEPSARGLGRCGGGSGDVLRWRVRFSDARGALLLARRPEGLLGTTDARPPEAG
jgi:hypothetical protein